LIFNNCGFHSGWVRNIRLESLVGI
jgi:hypothetical protein